MKTYQVLLFFICVLVGCRTIEPIAPAVTEQKAPMPEQPVSTIVLPIAVDISSYYKLADEQVDYKFDGGEQHCSGVSYSYHFERDPMKLAVNDRTVDINVSGKYRLKLNYCPDCSALFSDEPHCIIPRLYFSCGYDEPMRRMKLQYRSEFGLTSDYGIRTTTKLTELKAIDPCEVSFIEYDITDELVKEVRKELVKLATDIDKQTAAISFKKEAADLWNQAVTSIEIPGYGFIQLQPTTLQLTNPVIRNNILSTSLVMEAKPRFFTQKPEDQAIELPPLQLTESVPNDTLKLTADLHLRYDSLSGIMNRYMSGTKLLIKKREIILDSVRIAGANDQQLIFKVGFSGDKKGVLYITGKPAFNTLLQQIELTEVAFDIETKSTLLKTAEWLFSDRILDEITKNSKQDLKPQLDLLLTELNKSLYIEKEGFIVTGKMTDLLVDQVYPETEQLIVRVSSKGKLSLSNIRN
ncbi:MAG TPA: DUF4403 family protein [Fluviicola sp.]|nr:DUF4403 family protein [Fluviicola sp.]